MARKLPSMAALGNSETHLDERQVKIAGVAFFQPQPLNGGQHLFHRRVG
jgi:hypothetical protein